MLAMISRFIRMQKSVRLALLEAGSSLTFTDDDIEVLKQLEQVLQPAKDAVERLSRRNATLLTAERINDVVLGNLEKVASQNPLAKTFRGLLKTELKKRRPTELVHLMEYLNDSSYIKKVKKDSFGHEPNMHYLVDLASALLSRLYSIDDAQGFNESHF